ncbi:MAG: hypothetical protein C4310_12790 [Chloroflexota bacterium]
MFSAAIGDDDLHQRDTAEETVQIGVGMQVFVQRDVMDVGQVSFRVNPVLGLQAAQGCAVELIITLLQGGGLLRIQGQGIHDELADTVAHRIHQAGATRVERIIQVKEDIFEFTILVHHVFILVSAAIIALHQTGDKTQGNA